MEVLGSQATLILAALVSLAITTVAILRDVGTRRSAGAHVS
ncbi:MAG TPA: hypothetical protein VGK07_01595 [Candidatus Limnocylindria bacterium]|jgi:hypothetical protein